MVTGDDVLVEVTGPSDSVRLLLDGKDVTNKTTSRGTGEWLVTGLKPGRHRITAQRGNRRAIVTVADHPVKGPVFSGPHLPLLACSTEQFGLGAPTDRDCSAPTKVSWQYRSTDGSFKPLTDPAARPSDLATTTVSNRSVPYIVRDETGVINRSVYFISVLDPDVTDGKVFTDTGWNGRLVYRYGGGCGTSYGQGTPLGVTTDDDALLSGGYAVATATFNTFQVQCNDVLSAETTMMVKERFIETYGVPKFTIGDGGSGGAIQQLSIAQNYPGLLDAIAPTVPFPDAISISPGVADCGLLNAFFATPAGSGFNAEQQAAVSGYETFGSCVLWVVSFVGGVNPTDGCDGAIPVDKIYNAATNPKGLRCDLPNANRNQFGIDPKTGFARRPLDNVGVQYGLKALNDGKITVAQFLDINENVGGYDIDGNVIKEREVATTADVRRSYATGRVLQGTKRVQSIPVITTNFYTDPVGDIHTRFRVFTIRERLRLANGGRDQNHTVWTRPTTGDLVATLTGAVGDTASLTETLDEWLTTGKRPDAAIDNCITAQGERVAGDDVYDKPDACTEQYPAFGDPRTAAGESVRNDVLKCQLRPIAASEYKPTFDSAQMARLKKAFPEGVCDWTKRGVGYTGVAGTWFDYSNPARPVPRGTK